MPQPPHSRIDVDPQSASATLPTPTTRFLRTFVPWQLVRFIAINLKMFRIIWRGHSG